MAGQPYDPPGPDPDTVPDWVYGEPGDRGLDLVALDALGPLRPVWTRHFTTWKAFRRYVASVTNGSRLSISEWSTVAEFNRAARENVTQGVPDW